MKICRLIILIVYLTGSPIFAQGKFDLQGAGSDRINFQLIHNLIIIPVEVNGVELSFLLDTGVSKPIIFNFLNLNQELHINQAELIYLRGLGEGESIEALKSTNNIFRIGEAINVNQDLYAVFDPALNFAPRLGVPIHGIIGYDLLKDFVVEINYSGKFLKIHDPLLYKPKKCKSCQSVNLSFHNNKPYIDAAIRISDKTVPVKLLIDTGGSDAIWLFEDQKAGISIPDKFFDDFLGRGLSGSVYGKRAKIDNFILKEFNLKEVNAAFPDSVSIAYAKRIKDRNGSVSGEILKRFNIIFDYQKAKVTVRKNANFKRPFYYNKSGITLEHSGVRVVKQRDASGLLFPVKDSYGNRNATSHSTIVLSGSYKYSLAPAFTVVELRDNSPAKLAGIEIGDIILSVNGKDAQNYSLQEVIQLFYGETGKRINLMVDRNGIRLRFQFRLKDLL
jgi:hypothetical protein